MINYRNGNQLNLLPFDLLHLRHAIASRTAGVIERLQDGNFDSALVRRISETSGHFALLAAVATIAFLIFRQMLSA